MSFYTVAATYGVTKVSQARWGAVDVSTAAVHDLFQNYRKLYLTLTTIFTQTPIYVDMDSLRSAYSAFTGTVQDLLDSFGTNAVPSVASIPVANPKYARYADLFRAGYKLELMSNTGSFTAPAIADDKKRLRISRSNPSTDMQHFYKSCLVSINGFYHNTEFDGTYVYVNNAGGSVSKSRQNKAGILSFANLGNITQIPITKDMIYKQTDGSFLSERAYIELPTDVTGKTVMLVLGGYLHFLGGDGFFQTAEKTFCVDFNNIPMLDRYYESEPYIDYTSLGLAKTNDNLKQISLADFFSDTVLTNYLTMSQTFFVVLDTPEVFTNRIQTRLVGLPGLMISPKEPIYPLFVGYGRTAEYWKIEDKMQWSIQVTDNVLNRRVFDGLNKSELKTVSDQRVPSKTFNYSRGYFLEIGKDF
jgi:hypothetical protein